jgi:hypothetical protein
MCAWDMARIPALLQFLGQPRLDRGEAPRPKRARSLAVSATISTASRGGSPVRGWIMRLGGPKPYGTIPRTALIICA